MVWLPSHVLEGISGLVYTQPLSAGLHCLPSARGASKEWFISRRFLPRLPPLPRACQFQGDPVVSGQRWPPPQKPRPRLRWVSTSRAVFLSDCAHPDPGHWLSQDCRPEEGLHQARKHSPGPSLGQARSRRVFPPPVSVCINDFLCVIG